MESCPSGRRCSTRNAVYVMYLGFESLTLRQSKKAGFIACFFALIKIYIEGFEQGGSRRSLRKKTVLWTVFADVVKERSDAKAHGSVPKKSLTLRQSKKAGDETCFFALIFDKNI